MHGMYVQTVRKKEKLIYYIYGNDTLMHETPQNNLSTTKTDILALYQ
jgi:hypothetical protein